MQKVYSLFFFLALAVFACQALDVYKGLQLRLVQRNIDLSSQLARQHTLLSVINSGTKAASHLYLTFEEPRASHLSFLSVEEESKAQLTVGQPTEEKTATGLK